MTSPFRAGLEAAANELRRTAEDYEEIVRRRESVKPVLHQTRSYRDETDRFREKATLLRGQAFNIEQIPEPD